MSRIQQLPPRLVAQIAAGEVIERPASVLKELLENSLDAGSTRIDVDVGKGGLDFLHVVDNGAGIDPEDLPLAFATHATSKLRTAEDLFRIDTLGFRGEGLASIGAVSRVTLQSRRPDAERGAEVRCDGGQLSAVRVWNGAPGTRIEVRQLFFNTPVRRKFLRGQATEMGHVSDCFTRLALARLTRQMTLRHNGKTVHDVPASAGLLDRIALFFGDELRRQLRPVEGEGNGLTLGGYVADPTCERSGTAMQFYYVNGRWIRDRLLSQAVQEAYRGLLLTGRHPVVFLFLDLPPETVDVNVHPTKAEVRFRQPEQVQQLVVETVRRSLHAGDLTAPLRVRVVAPVTKAQAEIAFTPAPPASPPPETPREPRPVRAAQPPVAPPPAPTARPAPRTVAAAVAPADAAPAARAARAMQMHDLYLVVEVPEGILIVDQHALHERSLFEGLKRRLATGTLEVQKLLIPEPVHLTSGEALRLLEHRDALAELGLQIDDFGGGTVLVGSYPAVLGKRSPRDLLRGVLDYLLGQNALPPRDVLLNDLMALMACHAAVRAGDRLGPDEVQALVAQRHLADDHHHCPHGRPSSLLFSRADLDRQFRRTG